MVYIFANIIQVIMLSSSTNTFLGVDNSYPFGHITVWIDSPKEKRFELQRKVMNHLGG